MLPFYPNSLYNFLNYLNFQHNNMKQINSFYYMKFGPNGKYISTSQTKKRNVCLSVILEFCLQLLLWLSIVQLQPTAFVRCLKYLLKIPYFIQYYPSLVRFLIFKILCSGRSKTLPYVQKNITKMNSICVWQIMSSPNFHRMCV